MGFWEIVGEQRNQKSVNYTLHGLKSTATEVPHLTRVEV
jgi:hypothetical protein